MPTVDDVFRATAFDPDTIKLMGEAFDKARRSLHDTGQPFLVNEILAKRIIALASAGERDPIKLCEDALKALGTKAPER